MWNYNGEDTMELQFRERLILIDSRYWATAFISPPTTDQNIVPTVDIRSILR